MIDLANLPTRSKTFSVSATSRPSRPCALMAVQMSSQGASGTLLGTAYPATDKTGWQSRLWSSALWVGSTCMTYGKS